MTPAAKGIGCMLIGGALLTLNDALLKWLSAGLPVGQILALRGALSLLLIGAIAWRLGGCRALRIHHLPAQTARALLTVVATFAYVTGLRYLPLADAIAITFTGPLFLTVMAALLLGERVGWRRWSAVAVGFSGVLLMLQSSADVGGAALNWAALLPLLASFCGALRDVLTRRMSVSESSFATLAFTLLAVTLAGSVTLPFGWQPLASYREASVLALTAVLVLVAQFLLIETFRHAEASLVAPFKYFSFVWATLLGVLIWNELPGVWTVAGALLVVASGLVIFYREMALARRAGNGADATRR